MSLFAGCKRWFASQAKTLCIGTDYMIYKRLPFQPEWEPFYIRGAKSMCYSVFIYSMRIE